MSDRETPARDVLALLDRAAAHTPPLHLDRQDVVSRGQQIRRRQRAPHDHARRLLRRR